MQLHIGDHSGHTTLEFDPAVEDAVRAQVEEIFANLKSTGRAAYAVDGGERSQVRSLAEVPETATEVHVISPLVGG